MEKAGRARARGMGMWTCCRLSEDGVGDGVGSCLLEGDIPE